MSLQSVRPYVLSVSDTAVLPSLVTMTVTDATEDSHASSVCGILYNKNSDLAETKAAVFESPFSSYIIRQVRLLVKDYPSENLDN